MTAKIAVVTGASSGIGLAIARALGNGGHQMVFVDLNPPKEGIPEHASFIAADLTKRDHCKMVIDEVVERHRRVDILVNNAGVQHVSPIEDFPEDRWDYIMSLMLTAPFLLTKYAWPHLRAGGWGRIVNINSVHGLRASEYKSAYVSAKHGLAGLTKVAALEGAEYGITVNSVCPGYVRTPLVENQIADQAKVHHIPQDAVIKDIILKRSAIKKLISPEDVARMVLYLCSDAARTVTGASVSIDGGWTAQ
jgi:3-hydroxybutyrate dehydrogenase